MGKAHPDAFDYVHGFVQRAATPLRKKAERWIEGYENFIVKPLSTSSLSQLQTEYPYLAGLQLNPHIALKDPETHAAVTVIAANMFARTVGDAEFVRVVGRREEHQQIAAWTRAIKWMWRRPGHTQAYWLALLDSCLYGTGWLKNPVGPERRPVYEMVQAPVGENGATIPNYRARLDHTLEPQWIYVKPFSFYPDWGRLPLATNMVGGAELCALSERDFVDFIESHDERFYNKAALKRVIDNNQRTQFHTSEENVDWRRLMLEDLTEEEIALPNGFRPVQFFDYRGEVPWKVKESLASTKEERDREDELGQFRTVIVANGETVLDAPQPYYPHPWRNLTMLPVGGRPTGLPPAEVGAIEQDENDTMRTLQMQMAIDVGRSPILANMSVFTDVKLLQDAPSRQVIDVEGDPRTATGVVNRDYAGLAALGALIAQGRGTLREANGISGLLRGIAAGARTTREEIRQLTIASNLPLDVRVRLMEDEDLPAIARDVGPRMVVAYRDSDKPDAEVSARLGADVKLEHLLWTPDLQFIGSQQFRSGEGRAARLERLANFLISVPGATALANLPQIIVDLVRFETPDAADRYLNDVLTGLGQQAFLGAAVNAGGGQGPTQGIPSPPRNAASTVN